LHFFPFLLYSPLLLYICTPRAREQNMAHCWNWNQKK
jgi:hypothetical protein